MNDSRFQIQLPCPQCGGRVILEDTDRLFHCPFCRVRLALQATPQHTYVFSPKDSYRFRPLTYLPYWRFRGLAFALKADEVRHRILDVSAAAVGFPGMPSSLGLRPQAVPLSFYSPEIPGTFVEPTFPCKKWLKSLDFGLKDRSRPWASSMTYHALIGESVSLVYTPFFERNGTMHDAVTGRPLTSWSNELGHGIPAINTQPRLDFLPTLCPRCGGDMDGERDALVLQCRTCSRHWEMCGRAWHAVEVGRIAGVDEETVGAPFWVLDVAAQGFSLETVADFLTLTRAAALGPSKRTDQPFRFWVPAFKIAPQFFLRLGRAATVAQLETDAAASAHLPNHLYQVTLPSVEAFQACPILLGATSPAKEELLSKLRRAHLAFRGKKLVYLPLRRLSSEWLLEPFGLAFPLHALRWGRAL